MFRLFFSLKGGGVCWLHVFWGAFTNSETKLVEKLSIKFGFKPKLVNSYRLDQFLNTELNMRTFAYDRGSEYFNAFLDHLV